MFIHETATVDPSAVLGLPSVSGATSAWGRGARAPEHRAQHLAERGPRPRLELRVGGLVQVQVLRQDGEQPTVQLQRAAEPLHHGAGQQHGGAQRGHPPQLHRAASQGAGGLMQKPNNPVINISRKGFNKHFLVCILAELCTLHCVPGVTQLTVTILQTPSGHVKTRVR